MEAILPALAGGGGCSTVIELRNLGEIAALVDVEAHRADGALAGESSLRLHLAPGETRRRQIEASWARVRETVADNAWPALAVTAAVECQEGAEVRTSGREVAYATRNPWFAGEGDGSILMINTSERESKATLCYSTGGEYSMPGEPFRPICILSFDVQVPPFGSRTFPVRQGNSTHLELRTEGERVVLRMLRALPGSTRLFAVDSSITFGTDARAKDSAESITPPHFP